MIAYAFVSIMYLMSTSVDVQCEVCRECCNLFQPNISICLLAVSIGLLYTNGELYEIRSYGSKYKLFDNIIFNISQGGSVAKCIEQ